MNKILIAEDEAPIANLIKTALEGAGHRCVWAPDGAAAADLLGGAIVPLPFLPSWLRGIAQLTPFASMQNVPLRIFSGDIPLGQIPAAMGLQVLWIAVLGAAGYLLTKRGLGRAVILGG